VYNAPLTYDQPIANAGDNQIVVLPQSTATLDGSLSTNGGSGTLSYQWKQIFGSSVLNISDTQSAMPTLTGLIEGVYLMQLEVSNGTYTDIDEVYIISSTTNNIAPIVAILAPSNNASYYIGETVKISALASDLNDSIQRVDFFANGSFLVSDTVSPFNADWISELGTYELTAIAYDYNNGSSVSNIVRIVVVDAPPCRGTSWDGDFDYVFSDEKNNPTLTFIPSGSGVGTPTCILYYGKNPGSLPGYGVTANVPYKLTASEGELIHFYYTYSFPGVVEKNNSANKDNYIVGACRTTTSTEEIDNMRIKYYPNPVTNVLNIELADGKNQIAVYNLAGAQVHKAEINQTLFTYDMHHLPSGMYFVSVVNNDKKEVLKVIKQ
jgi:hypothetical protein